MVALKFQHADFSIKVVLKFQCSVAVLKKLTLKFQRSEFNWRLSSASLGTCLNTMNGTILLLFKEWKLNYILYTQCACLI